MENRKESQLAWKIWTTLDEFSSILWNVYETEFLEFCKEDHIPDSRDTDEKKGNMPF
jgi:hypothetical protein